MKKLVSILMMLFVASIVFAQSDLSIKVKKVPSLRITPDSMYFNSHVARTFTVLDIPQGCKLKGSFSGGDLFIHNNILTLRPVYVYRDSDVTKLDTKYLNGFKSTKNDAYEADLIINAIDSKGELKTMLKRKCYILYEKRPRNIQISAASYDAGAPGFLKILRDTVISTPAK